MSHQKQPTGQGGVPRFDEDDEDLMFRIMRGSCQGFGGCNSCALEQQLDLFAHCRQPMSFLSLFETSEPITSLPPGVYSMPNHCEYCSQKPCSNDCRRPQFYFQKKRPPFDNHDAKWEENGHPKAPERPSSPASSLFSGLFGRSRSTR